jgi:hypothetical protein
MIDWDGCELIQNCEMTWITGDGTFCDGPYALVELLFQSTVEQCVVLDGNWNWISYRVEPDSCAPESVFHDCMSDINIVKIRNGDFWIPALYDGIGCLDFTQMFKVHLDAAEAPCTNCVYGQPIRPSTPIAMNAGWNWIAYLPAVCYPPAVTLTSIWSDLELIKNQDGDFCIPGLYCGIDFLCPGEGYAAYMGAPGTLIYDTPSPFLAGMPGPETESIPGHFATAGKTADYQPILVTGASSGGISLEPGDEVGVFVGSLCIGAGVWNQEGLLPLAAWADDPQTEGKDGFLAGDRVTFRLWDRSKGAELFAEPLFDSGDPSLGESPVLIVRFILAQSGTTLKTGPVADTETALPERFSLSHQPNPAHIGTLFRMGIPEATPAALRIYTTSGRLVRSLVDGTLQAGYQEIEWDGRDENGQVVADGVYFYRFHSPKHETTMKLVFVR